MSTRLLVRLLAYGMLVPGIIGSAAMAAIVLPRGGHELTWPRLLAGCATLLTIQLAGALIGGRLAVRQLDRGVGPESARN
ncbi:hypothetical protein [Streptomyces sp. NPDC051662]|uniref:hypothetical protein n=1 Tax=Streptomyces sp. NPDC051662 TaxID=3154750 RepID=UPI00342DF2DD